MKAALLCIEQGCDIRDVSAAISWKDFEQLASVALKSFGYQTKTNVRFVRPKMEIDVVGILFSLALAIDCKHWRHTNSSSISRFSRKQVARAARLADSEHHIRVVPLILTLQAESVKFVDKVPVVPIAQFRSFLADVHGHLQEMVVIDRT
jgi:hypothetical protein